jgi:hypothetical protein
MKKYTWLVLTMLIAFSLLAAQCGGPEAPPEAEDEGVETEIEAEPPAEEAELEAVEEDNVEAPEAESQLGAKSDEIYTHPSGAFSMAMFGPEQETTDDTVIFYDDGAAVLAAYGEAPEDLTEDSLAGLSDELLNTFLVQTQVVESYETYVDQYEEGNNGYLVYFEAVAADTGEDNQGEIFLTQVDSTLYTLILLADDYDSVAEAWQATLESFTPNPEPEIAAVPEADPDTEVPAAPSTEGEMAADSGFRPEVNGFSFENYGNDSVQFNLTEAEMQRMFGDQVCANQAGGCTLTPPARQWMEQINGYMDGGHCEGMAVLSLLMYFDQIAASDFGGDVAHDLGLENDALQREIAYWWTTQSVFPAASERVNESPAVVLDTLIETFAAGAAAEESWTIGIYQPDFSGGHAITPFAVEDKGDGLYHVLVYDNNFPNETRFIEVDRNANTWSYLASTNPDEPLALYEGNLDTQTLELSPTSNRLVEQTCEFCAGQGFGMGDRTIGLAALQPGYNEIWLEGETDLLITTGDGQRIGYVGGEFVNEIPGALTKNFTFGGIDVWDINQEPVYRVPLGIEFSITVDASQATTGLTSTVVMIGPGYDLVVADLYLDPGQQDVITVSPDGRSLSYSTEYNDAPDMIFGVETPEADYEFIVAALDIEAGAEFAVNLDLENGDLSLNTDNTTEDGTYEIVMYRIDDESEQWFNNNDIYMEPGDTAYLNFLEWAGPGSSMFIDIDYGSDGEIDETLELPDEFEEE